MNDPCTVWIALSDREAIGEPLEADEQAFLAQHADRCPVCARERAVWDGLGGLIERPSAAPAPIDRSPLPVAPRRGGLRWQGMLASAAAVTLIAFGGAWSMSRMAPPWSTSRPSSATASAPLSAAPSAPSVPRSPSAAVSVSAFVAMAPGGEVGGVEVDGKVAAAGETIGVGSLVRARRGVACLTVEPGVRACLAEGSLLRVVELNASQRRLSLLVGRVAASLDPQPTGTSFGVVTRDGAAIAVGTAFSVEVPADQGASVTRVLHGTVLVRGATGREKRVTAHRMVVMDGEPTDLPKADEARELLLVDAPARVQAQTVEQEASRSTPVGSSPDGDAPASGPARGAIRLLLAAREARARGDAKAAATAYRALFARHESSPEAHAARIPYGEILLAEGAYDASLVSFETYLARGGALSEEASFGRVRALRALRSEAAERAALIDFLQAYPSSPLSESLRSRARALGVP